MKKIILILSLIMLIIITAFGCGKKETVNNSQPKSPIIKAQNEDNSKMSIKSSKDNEDYSQGGMAEFQLKSSDKKETLYITREDLNSSEGNKPVKLTFSINGTNTVFESSWNDGVYASVADFDKADKDINVYVIETGTDIESNMYIYKYNGDGLNMYAEIKMYGKDFYYDENGKIYYWYNDSSKTEYNTYFDYRTKQTGNISDEKLKNSLNISNKGNANGTNTKGTDEYSGVPNFSEVSEAGATKIVSDYLGKSNKNYYINLDHSDTLNGKEYFVFQYYEFVIDDENTKEGHTATLGWYYVDKTNGKLYLMDMAAGNLELIK